MKKEKIFNRRTALFVLLFIAAFAAGKLLGNHFSDPSVETKISGGKQVNILFMGIDARTNEQNSRSDTMIMASIDGKNKKVALVWIPRDTRVEVSRNRYDKINSVNYTKGPEAACDVAGKLLGTKVNYYVVTNFNGFAEIIDILGGVNINVEHDMYHWDPDPKLQINLSAGQQHLNGQQALGYVRFRGVPTADIGRTGLQQNFVKALAQEMFKTSTILKLHKLVPEIAKNVKTNIPADDMLYLVKTARDFDTENLITQTLPGYSFTDPASGASYWQADEKIANGIIEALFAGETFDVAQARPSWATQKPASPTPQPVEQEGEETENEIPQEELPDELIPATEGEGVNPEGESDGAAEELAGENTDSAHIGAEGYIPEKPDSTEQITPQSPPENTNNNQEIKL